MHLFQRLIYIHRTKTTAAARTTISHARNRHLIVPWRTSRWRCKKRRRRKKMKDISTHWYKTNWSSSYERQWSNADIIGQWRFMTCGHFDWTSPQLVRMRKRIGSLRDWSLSDNDGDGSTWENSFFFPQRVIKWSESSQQCMETSKWTSSSSSSSIRDILRNPLDNETIGRRRCSHCPLEKLVHSCVDVLRQTSVI